MMEKGENLDAANKYKKYLFHLVAINNINKKLF